MPGQKRIPAGLAGFFFPREPCRAKHPTPGQYVQEGNHAGMMGVRHALGGATVSLVDESRRNAWRYSLGLNHHASPKVTWRAGVAYDQSPVPDASHRTSRIPDADRTWLAVGMQYSLSPQARLDFGYAHLFVKEARIDHTASGTRLIGTYNNHVDILGAQYTHTFRHGP